MSDPDATADPAPETAPVATERPQWGAFALLCASYLAATVGEQLLSPLFPSASEELGMDVANAGIAFGVLTASIAVGNLGGGFALGRLGPGRLIRYSAMVSAVGAAVAATAGGFPQLLAGQILLGLGAGFYFPAGIQAVGLLAGPSRKGLAMGIYGVAFSGGLTLAALLGALGASVGWRVSFWVSAGLSVLAMLSSLGIRVRAPFDPNQRRRIPMAAVFGTPTAVGSIGTIGQYGAIPFLVLYAVDDWGLSAAGAATLLAVGRVISIVAKLISGASADRVGPRASGRRIGLVLTATGLAWVLLPGGWITYGLAAIFAGTVSSVFPISNVLAVEQFGQNGIALGAYRSAQIGIGALAGFLIGLIGEAVGLEFTLTIAVLTPLTMLWICREPSAPSTTGSTAGSSSGPAPRSG